MPQVPGHAADLNHVLQQMPPPGRVIFMTMWYPHHVILHFSIRYQEKRPDLNQVLQQMLPPGRAIFMRRLKNKITAKEKRTRDRAAKKAAKRERKAEEDALKRDRKAQVGFILRLNFRNVPLGAQGIKAERKRKV